MNYCVLTHTTDENGRISAKSVIACASKAEAEAMADLLGNGRNINNRRAVVCVTGYTLAGKYLLPLDELTYIKAEVASETRAKVSYDE